MKTTNDVTASLVHLPLSLVLGGFLGLLGAFVIAAVGVVATYRSHWQRSRDSRQVLFVTWIDPLLVLIASSFFFSAFDRVSLNDWSVSMLTATTSQSLTKLALFATGLTFLLPLSTTLAIPAGVWFPSFVLGATIGRIYGELLQAYFSVHVEPIIYALIGAASFTAAVTGSVSAAVIALETTGYFVTLVPCNHDNHTIKNCI
jgi:H+/Cl- antiporter ClcA